MVLEKTQTKQITITSVAANAVRELLTKRDLEGYALRVFVSGGGCAGFQYGMALEENIQEKDHLYEQHGVKIVVDEISVDYLNGAKIDYVDEPMGSGFKIENPNTFAAYSCASSCQGKDESGSFSSEGCSGC